MQHRRNAGRIINLSCREVSVTCVIFHSVSRSMSRSAHCSRLQAGCCAAKGKAPNMRDKYPPMVFLSALFRGLVCRPGLQAPLPACDDARIERRDLNIIGIRGTKDA